MDAAGVHRPPGCYRTAAQETESTGRLFYYSPENVEALAAPFSLHSLIAQENIPSFLMKPIIP